ncbi:hypothetical protein Vretifemale_3533 [Volvox reticuliferus]|uniref:USP domain-containing protein n=1 Tax=Volvox reticuliferus TaxID=1737510 RepID=A0A8J4C4T4_9CHLO|nr:hypothetical protein Vretifemale_3533 [Volvox reticuliferus]
MARHEDPRSPSESWEDAEDEESEELLGASFFPPMQNRLLTGEILGNALRASDLRIALEALAKYANDPTVEFVNQDILPPGWDDAKEFIGVVLQSAMDKFYRMDVFLRMHQDYPEQLFACMYYLCYACTGFTAIVSESSAAFGDLHDQELCGLLSATYNMLDSRSAVYQLQCVRQLPNLETLIDRTENYLMAQPPGQVSCGESDDEVAEATDGVIHVHGAEGGNHWQAYLVQLLLGTGFVENAMKILTAPMLHTMQLHSSLLGLVSLLVQLLSNVVHQQLSQERRLAVERGIAGFLSWVADDVLADPEKLFSGRERASQWLSHALANCHEMMQELQLPNTQLTAVQRQVVTEMLKSSNFSRLLSAVQECRSLLSYSSRRSSQMLEGNTDPDVIGIEENVRWLDEERIVKQMLRVNLHQSQYVDAVLGILRVLAECGHFNDEHLDMLWGVTEQEDTFDAVKTNVCHMIKQLAQHLRPQQLDLLFSKFENRKGRTLPDTLRLLDLLRRLAQSDTKKASSMAGKLVELVWELTTPVDAPPELLDSSVMLDVLEGYKQHALLHEYIQRCIAQLRARTNVYTALTVLQNLLRLWGKLYGWEARSGPTREERRSGGPRPLCELLGALDRESSSVATPPLSRLLVDNLVDFMAAAARWLEERRVPHLSNGGFSSTGGAGGSAVPPTGMAGGGGGGGGGSVTQQPPGQGSYSYQQIVRRYLDVFRLVSQCKDTYVELRHVEALWDAVVLRPNTPEDMPSGLDLVLACAGEGDDDAQADAAGADGLVIPPGPLLEPRDLCKLLQDRVTRLPVDNLAQPAFACFKACLQAAQAGLEEHLRHLAAHAARSTRGELGEQETVRLIQTVRVLGQGYLWQIVLDCQRSEVTSSASDMLINEMYGRDGINDMISDTRTRLMEAAALLTAAPPCTQEWEHIELPVDVMESSRWELARTRATRCMQLLEQLAGKSEESMPPVPMHSASWQGPSLLLEVTTQEQGRIKIGCTANEYVGLLRRKVAQRLGVEPACVRLVVGGQELRTDGRTLQSAFPSTWSSRQTLLAQVSPRANRYTRFGEDWWAAWHSGSTLAHMYHDDQLYRVLLLLADLPKAPGVRAAASRLLQQLPTCSWVPAGLLEALHSDQPAAQLRGQLLGPGGGVERPGLLLYTLQALYALLQPSYPVDLLPLVSKPWPSTQPPHDGVSGGLDVAVAHPTAGQQPPAQHQRQQAAAASASQVWWQVVAAGGAAERLLPVLAKCVPLLAEVVNKVMAPVAGAAEAATAAAVAAASNPVPSPLLDVGRLAATQPAADLAFVKDFQWVMLFLLCNIYQRARRGPSLDNRPPFTCAVGEAAATAVARAQPADSLSSSHGQELQDGGTSSAAAPRPNQQPHTHPQQLQARDPRHDATAVPGGPQGCRAASGGQESEAQTQEATAGPLYGNGGGGIAATPEVTSADAETCTSTQRTQECGDSAHLQPACASGSAAVAALVSGLVVSSHGSPDAAAEAGRDPAASSYMDISVGGAAAPAPRSHTNVASQPLPLPSPLPPLEATSLSAQVPVFGSSTDVEMAAASGSHVDAVQQLLSASSSQQHAPGAPSQAFSVSIAGPSVTAAGAAAGAAPGVIQSAGGGVPVAGDGHANLLHYLGAEGMRCLVSLLVRMAYDAGCLWGYGRLMVAQQQGGPGAGRSLLGVGAVAAAAVAPSYQQMCAAADVACRLASKALQVLSRLVHWPDLRNAFFADPSAVPMLLETLSCEFSPAIRDCALNHLEGVFAGGLQLQLPPQHYIWVLKSLVSLRPAMEYRLESCLEFHVLLAKVLHQLPELASPSAEARLLADSVLSEEVARLDVGAEELMQPKRALLLRGKLMLVRELVRALERLGLGLGANGRPGLISILLNRYLFPEAQPLWQPDASHSIMEAALQHVAADAGVRREALQLVQFLMTACPSNLEQGFRDLSRLHYDNGLRTIDRKFDIGGEGVKSEGSYVGLRNGGATCYMNSVLQQLFMQPRIRELVLQAGAVDLEEQQDSVFHQLQVMFAHLRLGRASCYHPRSFWQSFKDYDGQPIDVREHQDAYEFFTRLQDSVDSYLRATGQTPAMQAVMGGKFAAQIICKDVNYRSEREEEFYQISVEVAGFNSLEKSLEGYVAGELMEGDNSYYCEELGARVAAVRRTVIKELPHTLVIHLKRFEYDHLNMTRYKLRDRFEFPVVLDMFKYTADGLAALEGTGSPSATTAQGSDGASGRAVGPSSGGAGADAGARPRNCYLYELKGIVVHSGTAFAGHYYSFIKERPKLGEDQQVSAGRCVRKCIWIRVWE